MAPEKLTPEQMKVVWNLSNQHPQTWERGCWYPANMAGRPVEIRRTHKGHTPYLGVRKQITVNLKDPQGNVISTRKEWEYFTVNLQTGTVTYQGW